MAFKKKISNFPSDIGIAKPSENKAQDPLSQSVQRTNLETIKMDESVVKLINERFARNHKVLPVQKIGKVILVAFSEKNLELERNVSVILRSKIQCIFASEKQIIEFIDNFWSDSLMGNSFEADYDEIAIDSENTEKGILIDHQQKEKGAVVRFVNSVFNEAVKTKASDIHFEVYEASFRVRFRINGVLKEVAKLPHEIAPSVISRIKILAQMNIAERRRPQDGRLKIRFSNGVRIDLRISSVPVLLGEKIVVRLLDKRNLQNDLTDVGFTAKDLSIVKRCLNQTQGMVLVTGPTGSGKTTTLYSFLKEKNKIDVNISTVEDPVEFNILGINQVQINPVIDFNFPEALRSFLRQDPDIIMVGEIRDLETGSIAYKAAATGHLVLSTLHTNDTISSVNRLIDMGILPYVIADYTDLVIAQRLLKTLCPKCKRTKKIEEPMLLDLGIKPEELHEFKENLFVSIGCKACKETGIGGRIGIFEILEFLPNIKQALFQKKPSAEIKKIAIEQNGMITLRKAALQCLKKGIVSVEEVIKGTIGDKDNVI